MTFLIIWILCGLLSFGGAALLSMLYGEPIRVIDVFLTLPLLFVMGPIAFFYILFELMHELTEEKDYTVLPKWLRHELWSPTPKNLGDN